MGDGVFFNHAMHACIILYTNFCSETLLMFNLKYGD